MQHTWSGCASGHHGDYQEIKSKCGISRFPTEMDKQLV